MSRITECQVLYDNILRYGGDPPRDHMKFACNPKVFRQLLDELHDHYRGINLPMPAKRFRGRFAVFVCGLPVKRDRTIEVDEVVLKARLPRKRIS